MNRIGKVKYNFIHYRYEDDWNINLKKWNQKYIVPPLDILIDKLPFKNNYPVYIATSEISSLNEKKLLQKPIDSYTNILYKYSNEVENLSFDECGFVDFLIGKNCEEIYGFHFSGFSIALNKIKNTENYYSQIPDFEIFSKKI